MMSIEKPVPPIQRRFHLLDALRGVAAILVVLYHSTDILPALHFPNTFLAVDFFFCLSGFVIAYSYEQRLETIGLGEFYVMRMIRLFPMYLLGMLVVLARTPLSPDRLAFFHNHGANFVLVLLLGLFFLPDFFPVSATTPLYPFNIFGWSLLYELIANMAYALTVRLKLARVVLPLSACASVLYLAYRAATGLPSMEAGFYLSGAPIALARVCFSFIAGVYLHKWFQARPAQFRHGYFAAAMPAIVLVVMLMVRPSWAVTSWIQLAFIVVVSPTIVAFASTVQLPTLISRSCVVLGELSYPLYVIHAGFLLPRNGAMLTHLPTWKAALVLMAYLCLAAAVTWAAGRYIDLPIRKRLTKTYRDWKTVQSPEPLPRRLAEL